MSFFKDRHLSKLHYIQGDADEAFQHQRLWASQVQLQRFLQFRLFVHKDLKFSENRNNLFPSLRMNTFQNTRFMFQCNNVRCNFFKQRLRRDINMAPFCVFCVFLWQWYSATNWASIAITESSVALNPVVRMNIFFSVGYNNAPWSSLAAEGFRAHYQG